MNSFNPVNMEFDNQSKDEIKKSLKKCSSRNSILLLLFFVITYAIYFPFSALLNQITTGLNEDIKNTVYTMSAFLIQFVIAVPVVLIIGNRKQSHTVKTYFEKPKQSKKFIAKWIFIAIGITYAVNYVSTMLFTVIQAVSGKEFVQVDFTSKPNLFNQIVMVTALIVLAPIFEELLFRGTILTHTICYGKWFAIVIVGLSFGLYHMNYAQTFGTAAFGMILCFIAIKTESIIPCMVAHFCLNSVGAVQSVLIGYVDMEQLLDPTSNVKYMMENIGTVGSIMSIGFLCIGLSIAATVLLIIEICKHKETFKLDNPCTVLSTKEKILSYISSPFTIILIVALLTMTILRLLGINI